MRAFPLALILFLGACGGSAEKTDLANAGKARSLLAEASLNLELAPRTAATWTEQTRREAGAQLAALAAEARSAGGADSATIAQVATLPDHPDVALLQARTAEARTIEARIEARLESR